MYLLTREYSLRSPKMGMATRARGGPDAYLVKWIKQVTLEVYLTADLPG